MRRQTFITFVLSAILSILLTSCQGLSIPIFLFSTRTPTPTVKPTLTPKPTITPTPAPQLIQPSFLLDNCARLDEENVHVVFEGIVYMPEGFVYGYEGWYGMDLVSTSRLRVLFAIGDSPNQMEKLPFDFRKQDLKIYAFDGRLIQDGHKIRVTGRPKYRSDDENRKCELWVDVVESLMPMEVTTPLDLQVGEIGCRPLDTARQLIRLKGSLKINRNNYTCWMNEC